MKHPDKMTAEQMRKVLYDIIDVETHNRNLCLARNKEGYICSRVQHGNKNHVALGSEGKVLAAWDS
jgi:hypothetical protein